MSMTPHFVLWRRVFIPYVWKIYQVKIWGRWWATLKVCSSSFKTAPIYQLESWDCLPKLYIHPTLTTPPHIWGWSTLLISGWSITIRWHTLLATWTKRSPNLGPSIERWNGHHPSSARLPAFISIATISEKVVKVDVVLEVVVLNMNDDVLVMMVIGE